MTQLPGLLDTEAIRKDFPILDRQVHDGHKLVYLDNAATSQKPRQVLDALSEYYERYNANVHRGVHVLAEEATALYEGARDKVAEFINAPSRDEVIFTKNASESLNLVANMLGWADEPYRVDHETEIVITEMEHHSNIVPWQLLAQRTGAKLRWFGLTDDGRLDLSNIDEVITEKTKIVSFVLVSNILGTQNPVEAIVRRAQEVGALVCVDASQAAPHMPLDVQAPASASTIVAFTGPSGRCGHRRPQPPQRRRRGGTMPLGSTTYHVRDPRRPRAWLAALRQANEGFAGVVAAHPALSRPDVDLPGELARVLGEWLGGDRTGVELEYELYLAALRRPALRPVAAEWAEGVGALLAARTDPTTARALVAVLDGICLQVLLTDTPYDEEYAREVLARVVPAPGTRDAPGPGSHRRAAAG
ncbi:Cysteine desulfurase [Streptomyces tendae]